MLGYSEGDPTSVDIIDGRIEAGRKESRKRLFSGWDIFKLTVKRPNDCYDVNTVGGQTFASKV
jgi:hypothetical protein